MIFKWRHLPRHVYINYGMLKWHAEINHRHCDLSALSCSSKWNCAAFRRGALLVDNGSIIVDVAPKAGGGDIFERRAERRRQRRAKTGTRCVVAAADDHRARRVSVPSSGERLWRREQRVNSWPMAEIFMTWQLSRAVRFMKMILSGIIRRRAGAHAGRAARWRLRAYSAIIDEISSRGSNLNLGQHRQACADDGESVVIGRASICLYCAGEIGDRAGGDIGDVRGIGNAWRELYAGDAACGDGDVIPSCR